MTNPVLCRVVFVQWRNHRQQACLVNAQMTHGGYRKMVFKYKKIAQIYKFTADKPMKLSTVSNRRNKCPWKKNVT